MRTTALSLTILAGGLIVLAACDSKPNADFEKNYKEAQARQAGDKFTALSANSGRLTRYLQAEDAQKANYLTSFSSSAANAVTAAMTTLRKLPIGGHDAVAAQCKVAIGAAQTFRATPPPADQVMATAAPIGAALNVCRQAAHQAEDAEASPDVKEALQGWRRTASSAMMLLGVAGLEAGAHDDGVKLWREADKAMTADQPGKTLRASDFYYSMR